MLAVFQYCEDEPFVVERGEVKTPDGKVLNYPTLQYRKEVVVASWLALARVIVSQAAHS